MLFITLAYLGGLYLLWLACRLASTTLHELGHALAALACQAGPVVVYLGSYGQPVGSGHLRLGRLQLYVKYAIWKWHGGMCQYDPLPTDAAPWRNALILLAGPLLPLLVATAGLYGSFYYGNNLLKFATVLGSLFVVLPSLLASLLPNRQPIVLADGRRTYNDGTQLRRHLRGQASAAQLIPQAADQFHQGQYTESARLFEEVLAQAGATAELLRAAAAAHHRAGDYHAALGHRAQLARQFAVKLTNEDVLQTALLHSLTNQHALAQATYTALIEQPEPYLPAYSNRGYTYSLLGEYELALADFGQVLAADPTSAYAHCQRGLVLARQGHEAAGLAELQAGLALDAANAYNYLALGLYYFERYEYTAALASFEQAWTLDPHAHRLADYLQKTRQLLAAAETGGWQP